MVVDDVDYYGIRLGVGALSGRPSVGQIPIVGAALVAIGVAGAVGAVLANTRAFAAICGLFTSTLTTWVVVAAAGAQTEDGANGLAAVAGGVFSGPVLASLAAFLFFVVAALDAPGAPIEVDLELPNGQSEGASLSSSDSTGTEVIAATS